MESARKRCGSAKKRRKDIWRKISTSYFDGTFRFLSSRRSRRKRGCTGKTIRPHRVAVGRQGSGARNQGSGINNQEAGSRNKQSSEKSLPDEAVYGIRAGAFGHSNFLSIRGRTHCKRRKSSF